MDMFRLDIADEDARRVVGVHGEIDASAAARFEQALVGALGGSVGPSAIDLRGVHFIDAAGLAALLRVAALAEAGGDMFAVTGASSPARRLIDITGTATLLNLRDNVALQSSSEPIAGGQRV